MKKIILSLFLISILTTGCTTIDTTLTLDPDKSDAKIETKLTYKQNLYDKTDERALTILSNYKKFTDDKTSITLDKENSTILAQKSVKNIRKQDLDLSSMGFVSNISGGKFIDVKKNLFVTSYSIDMVYNLPRIKKDINIQETQKNHTSTGLQPEYFQEYADRKSIITDQKDNSRNDIIENYENNFNDEYIPETVNDNNIETQSDLFNIEDLDAKFTIKVPGLASYNNADRMDGFSYIWNIRKDMPTIIRFQYVVYSGFAIGFVILLGIAGIIYFARRIYRRETLRRIDLNK